MVGIVAVAAVDGGGWTALVAGVLLATYWGRVAKMAWKARKSHAGHALPPEDLGRKLRMLWAPVVGLWVLLPLWMWLGWGPPVIARPLYDSNLVELLGLLLMIAALTGTWRCWKLMGKHWRMGIDPSENNTLLTTGPWAYVRHPIYSLSILLAVGSWLAAPGGPLAAVILAHICLIVWEARREEEHLTKVHGEAYHRYQQVTGALVPRMSKAQTRDVI